MNEKAVYIYADKDLILTVSFRRRIESWLFRKLIQRNLYGNPHLNTLHRTIRFKKVA